MKVYVGVRETDEDTHVEETEVWVEDGERRYNLSPRLDVRNHSPTGFEWGYQGSGPAQLALGILCDLLGKGHEDEASAYYQGFKGLVVGSFPKDGFRLTEEEARAKLEQVKEQRARA